MRQVLVHCIGPSSIFPRSISENSPALLLPEINLQSALKESACLDGVVFSFIEHCRISSDFTQWTYIKEVRDIYVCPCKDTGYV